MATLWTTNPVAICWLNSSEFQASSYSLLFSLHLWKVYLHPENQEFSQCQLFVVTGSTTCCYNNNLQGSQWWQNWRHENCQFSMVWVCIMIWSWIENELLFEGMTAQWTLKQLGYFLQKFILVFYVIHCRRYPCTWNQLNTTTALWILMAWCQSAGALIATVLIMHWCVSKYLGVNWSRPSPH